MRVIRHYLAYPRVGQDEPVARWAEGEIADCQPAQAVHVEGIALPTVPLSSNQ